MLIVIRKDKMNCLCFFYKDKKCIDCLQPIARGSSDKDVVAMWVVARKERLIKNLLSKFRRQHDSGDVGGRPRILLRRILFGQSKKMLKQKTWDSLICLQTVSLWKGAPLRHARAGEEQSDSAWRSLLKRRQESLAASPLLQRESARRLASGQAYNM